MVNWDVPEHDGGSPITDYIVERRDVKREAFVKVGEVKADVLSLKVEKLVEGNQYVFQVKAVNAVGDSDPAASEPVTAKLPFGTYASILCLGLLKLVEVQKAIANLSKGI